MKSRILVLTIAAMAMASLAEPTNAVKRAGDDEHRMGKIKERYGNLSPEERGRMQERRLELMEKTLAEIGVTEEQRAQIAEIQRRHMESMRSSMKQLEETRKHLSGLEKSGASKEEIFAAVDAVSEAQSEQMKVLIRNRMEMEEILGKEKYEQFMDAARSQYRKHGHRGGMGLPPKPDTSPLPGKDRELEDPPVPGSP